MSVATMLALPILAPSLLMATASSVPDELDYVPGPTGPADDDDGPGAGAEDDPGLFEAALGVALHRARRARPEPQPTMQLPSAASSREHCGRQQTSSQHIEPA